MMQLKLQTLKSLQVAPKKPVCWFTWVILGVWPVLAFLGVLIQWKVTAEGFSHTEGECCHQAHTQLHSLYQNCVKTNLKK